MSSHQVFSTDHNNDWVIAFYGYGQSANVYAPLYEQVKHKLNIIVIDLPTKKAESEITIEAFKQFVVSLLEQYNVSTFQSLSYSMSGRLNLYLPQLLSNRLTKIILVAPDIGMNFWNKIAVRTRLGHSLFSYFVQKENMYLNVISFLHKAGILNKTLYAFSKWNMRDRVQRDKVYNTWINTKYFVPNLTDVNRAIEQHQISLVSYFGKKDVLVPFGVYKKFVKVFPNSQHHLNDQDHNMLKPDFFTLLAQELL